MSDTTPGKPSVYGIRLYIYLEHQVVSNLSSGDVLSIGITNSHGAGGRWPGVGNSSRSGQHGHIEPNVNLLDASVVDTSYSVGLGLVGHKLGMLLDHQDKVCFTLENENILDS